MIGDEDAVSSVVDFVVAMGVFIVVLALFFTFSPLGARPEPDASGQATAEATVDALVGRPGLGEGVGTDWSTAPENLSVLGLRDGRADRLAFDKIVALAHGTRRADAANGAVDYPEARRALGLDRFTVDYDLRIEIRPDPGGDDATWRTDRLEGVRVAYVGQSGDETAMIEGTALRFATDDDVYADTVEGVDDLLVELPRYQVLVVGSGADHAALDRPSVRSRLATWVDAAGSVVALGSGQATGGWLGTVLDTPSVGPAPGPIAEANASANLGTNPHDLRIGDYDPVPDGPANDTWSTGSRVTRLAFAGEAPARFALGHGLHGNGSVTLTTYRPTAIADAVGDAEARRFVANLLAFAATGPVNLDHGIPPVDDARSWTADRTTVVDHPRTGSVRVRVAVTLW